MAAPPFSDMSDLKVIIHPKARSLLRDSGKYDYIDLLTDEIAEACVTIKEAISIAVIKTEDPITLRFLLHLGGYTKDDIQKAYDYVVAANKTAFIKEFQRAGM